jgi:hypothetical protein
VLEQTDLTDPQNRFRSGLLKLAYSYARLVVLSFGFQHAFGKNNQDENPFLNRVSDKDTQISPLTCSWLSPVRCCGFRCRQGYRGRGW